MSCCGIRRARFYVAVRDSTASLVAIKEGQILERIQSNGASISTGFNFAGSGTYSPGPIFSGVCPNELAKKNRTLVLNASAFATTVGHNPSNSVRTAAEFSSSAD